VNDLTYHEARVLLLVDAFSTGTRGLEGLTKLAKLDFFLRYPGYLDRLLRIEQRAWPEDSPPSSEELASTDDAMIRYKYGPWDDRYYVIISRLLARDLIQPTGGGGRVNLRTTELGAHLARDLAALPMWKMTAVRVQFLRKLFANATGNSLRKRIYRLFPEAMDRPYRDRIPS
jgi:hypothetical protein